MTGFTCAKCSRRFTPSAADVQAYLQESAGKKYVQVLCPHCSYANKIAVSRLQQAPRPG
jgi:DNA-directed RNA polymerase subunit RPC12/RpoP